MKPFLWAGLFLVTLSTVVFAQGVEIPLEWRGDPTAVDYRVWTSVDGGVTWKMAAVFVQPSPFPADWRLKGTIPRPEPLPANGLVLLRVSARNAKGERTSTDKGAWVNPKWTAPESTNLGVLQ